MKTTNKSKKSDRAYSVVRRSQCGEREDLNRELKKKEPVTGTSGGTVVQQQKEQQHNPSWRHRELMKLKHGARGEEWQEGEDARAMQKLAEKVGLCSTSSDKPGESLSKFKLVV